MSIGELLTVLALILNLITLFIVLYQTALSKKGFKLSKTSFDNDKRIREMGLITEINYVIHVQMELDTWAKNINSVKEEMQVALKDNNADALENIANRGLSTCKGLVDKFYYENCPKWLSEIYITGAKYYYYVFAPIKSLWDSQENKSRLDSIDWSGGSLIERCDEAEYYIKELLKYIDDAIPDIFKNAPASIADNKFLSD